MLLLLIAVGAQGKWRIRATLCWRPEGPMPTSTMSEQPQPLPKPVAVVSRQGGQGMLGWESLAA